MKSNLTIFANFYIDNEERLLRMKDSLESMKGILFDRYVVNVRGSFANQAVDYLKCNIKPLFVYSLESKNGWFFDTSKLLHLIKTQYVLLWMEDHICMSPKKINNVVEDMNKFQSDILVYTYWQQGKFLERYSKLHTTEARSIFWFDHTAIVHDQFKLNSFLISYPSILKKTLLEKVINPGSEGPWSKFTPFNFEKSATDKKWLPLRRAVPKSELFASIDDDHGEIGTSLQSRGLYPIRIGRESYAVAKNIWWKRIIKRLVIPIHQSILFIKVFILTMQVPQKYKLDYFMSFINPSKKITPLPWINYKAIDFITKKLPLVNNIFEYGSGNSTLFWLNHGKHVVSVEHDAEFYRQLNLKITHKGNIDYQLIEPEIDMNENPFNPEEPKYFQSSDFKGYSFRSYTESINKFSDEFFDLVLIDGRARNACIVNAVSKIKRGGMLILDNSNRKHYLEKTSPILSDWECYSFIGITRGLLHLEQTSIFIKPQ